MSGGNCLLADIGGTNVRFATIGDDGKVGRVESWLTALYPDFETAVRNYADLAGLKLPLASAAVCAAGPLIDGRIVLTNCGWEISERDIAKSTGAARVTLVNDFAAVARALPCLSDADLVQVGGGLPLDGFPKIALGPGTGLGVACVLPDAHGGWVVAAGEGGHVDLAPTTAREIAIVYQLMRDYGHVSVERVLSGPGLEALLLAIAALDGLSFKSRPIAQDIVKDAAAGKSEAAAEAVALFTGWLGSVAGNLALTLGARGGVYIAGGIIPQWGPVFDAKLFRRRFESKGRMRHFLEPIPCHVVMAKDLAFRGLAAMTG
jgi:glucokinase